MRKDVRDEAEVFFAIQELLKHLDFNLQHGDIEGALSNVAKIETLINKRFEVLLVADEAGFEAADRFQLYQSKIVLTSCSYKLAVADVAALKCARAGYTRGNRMPIRDGDTEGKGMPLATAMNPVSKGCAFVVASLVIWQMLALWEGEALKVPHPWCEEAHGAAPLATVHRWCVAGS
ncbi:unnamed protein product [Closterium sp. NIES-53]